MAALSRVGNLVVWVEVWEDVDTPKLCHCDLPASAEVLLLQLGLEVLVVVSAVDSVGPRAEVDFEEASEEVIDQTSEADAEALDTKVEVALVERVGMVVVLLTAMATVQHHLPTLLLAQADEEASAVGMVVPL